MIPKWLCLQQCREQGFVEEPDTAGAPQAVRYREALLLSTPKVSYALHRRVLARARAAVFA